MTNDGGSFPFCSRQPCSRPRPPPPPRREAKCDVNCLEIKGRTHGSVALKIAEEGDPVRKAVVEFIGKNGAKSGK